MKRVLLAAAATLVVASTMTLGTFAAAAGAAASAGSTSPADQLTAGNSDHAYIVRLNTICRRSLGHVNQLVATYNGSAHTVGDFLALLNGEVQGSKSELRKILKLRRPNDLAGGIGTATSQTQALIADSRSVIAGITLLDQSAPWNNGAVVPSGSALSSNITALNQDSDKADAAFATAGVTACAQDPNPTT